MKKILLLISFALCWLIFTQLQSQEKDKFQLYKQLFEKAEALFNGIATDSTDSVALSYYTQITKQLQPDVSNATLLYNSYERSGILQQGLGLDNEEVLQNYYTAIQLQRKFYLSDSMLFRLLLSAGNVHYFKGLFDSSVFYFSWAEKIITRYPNAGLAGDLYNSLGALYNEAGNYVQSGIYFSKALELTRQTRPELKEAIFAMSANIASAVRASGYPDSALRLYKHLLDVAQPSLAIINNIGEIYLTKNQPDSALHYLQMVKEVKGNNAIAIYNTTAKAFMLKGDTAGAANHLQAATDLYKLNMPQVKSNQFAATLKYLGDLKIQEENPGAALPYYQQSIIQYNYKFNDTNVFANPGNFIGDFASYNLFDALAAKAACFALLYTESKSDQYFRAAINSYDSAFALSDYIKKSIDNDEARLFIADKLFDAYTKAVDFILSGDQHKNDEIIHALKWISKSRATSLAISLKENTIKQYAGLPDSLLRKEKNVKIGISRLKLQLQQSSDTVEQKELISAINTASLELQTIENKFKEFPNYYNQKFAADNIDISNIQKNVLDNYTAVITYFKGADKLYAFVVRHGAITEHQIDSDSVLERNIDVYTRELTMNNAGKLYNESAAIYLYNRLMQPLINDLSGITSLIIVPDQNLINIPFEAFQSGSGKYLVQDYSITYQYSLSFLQKSIMHFNKNSAVAFAPFAFKNVYANLNVLPSSVKEISGFPKKDQLINDAATKDKFTAVASEASVIHLATHAAVDFEEPENSFIAFYRQNNSDTGYKMFAHELYNLQLPHTQLVFLSACETGSGKLSRSEGALSISRAFAFAGCPNIITSLWKAEDNTTAYISEHFYKYVAKGYTYAQALQHAKIDLLADESMSQFYSPAYWSHLILIGDVQQEKSTTWWRIAVAGIIILILLTIMYKRNKHKS